MANAVTASEIYAPMQKSGGRRFRSAYSESSKEGRKMEYYAMKWLVKCF